MKKLMIVGAAALCATVGFCDPITSENTVGYAAVNDGGNYNPGQEIFPTWGSNSGFLRCREIFMD